MLILLHFILERADDERIQSFEISVKLFKRNLHLRSALELSLERVKVLWFLFRIESNLMFVTIDDDLGVEDLQFGIVEVLAHFSVNVVTDKAHASTVIRSRGVEWSELNKLNQVLVKLGLTTQKLDDLAHVFF